MEPLSHTIPAAVAGIVRNAPLSPGKVQFSWSSVVGAAVARVTAVRLEGTTLLVDTRSPEWAREMRRSSPVILRRLQSLLGTDALKGIVVRD
jgi:hypothetical protein